MSEENKAMVRRMVEDICGGACVRVSARVREWARAFREHRLPFLQPLCIGRTNQSVVPWNYLLQSCTGGKDCSVLESPSNNLHANG